MIEPALLERIFLALIGFTILQEFVIMINYGHWFSADKKVFLSAPFGFRRLPLALHRAVLLSLIPLGILVMSGLQPFAGICLIISAVGVFYLIGFCQSAWHHGIFLLSLLLLLSGLYFTVPVASTPNPFLLLIIFQISLVYICAGLSKITSWKLDRIFLVECLTPFWRRIFSKKPWLVHGTNAFVLAGEILLGIGLWIPLFRVQEFTIIAASIFHLIMFVMTRRGNVFHYETPIIFLLIISYYSGYYSTTLALWFIALPVLVTLGLFNGHYIKQGLKRFF